MGSTQIIIFGGKKTIDNFYAIFPGRNSRAGPFLFYSLPHQKLFFSMNIRRLLYRFGGITTASKDLQTFFQIPEDLYFEDEHFGTCCDMCNFEQSVGSCRTLKDARGLSIRKDRCQNSQKQANFCTPPHPPTQPPTHNLARSCAACRPLVAL